MRRRRPVGVLSKRRASDKHTQSMPCLSYEEQLQAQAALFGLKVDLRTARPVQSDGMTATKPTEYLPSLAAQRSDSTLSQSQRIQRADDALEAPAANLTKAMSCIQALTPAQLQELRSLRTPPDAVKRTVEMVFRLLNNSVTQVLPPWHTVRRRVVEMVPAISSGSLPLPTEQHVAHVRATYLVGPSALLPDTVRQASLACYALYCWAVVVVGEADEVTSEQLSGSREVPDSSTAAVETAALACDKVAGTADLKPPIPQTTTSAERALSEEAEQEHIGRVVYRPFEMPAADLFVESSSAQDIHLMAQLIRGSVSLDGLVFR